MYYCVSFHEAVGNVLVANDLDQASRIAFGDTKRWRVVTLAGQLIGAPGTMSGGGNLVARGGMSSKLAPEAVRSEELRAKEQENADEEWLTHAGPRLDRDSEELSRTAASMSKRRSNVVSKPVRAQSKPDARDVARNNTLEKETSSATSRFFLPQRNRSSGHLPQSCTLMVRTSWASSEGATWLPTLSISTVDKSSTEKIKNAKPDPGVLKDYKKRDEEFTRRTKDLEQLTD
ncbi:hypothetical protein F5141DRAFT_1059285 [Pisolithus sp. B1]|nr:hypothetical protein F5141DRAFT_1059285 [Pisolithus sp. B1]